MDVRIFQVMAEVTNLIRSGRDGSALAAVAEFLSEQMAGLEERLDGAPVVRPATPGQIHAVFAERFDLARPTPLPRLASELFELLAEGMVHPNHRRHFGLYVPGVRAAGVVGDTIAAMFNPQAGAWWYAPAAVELEAYVLGALAGKLGYDPQQSGAHFTSGGSEANASAVLLALTRAFPSYRQDGLRGLQAQPVVYLSDQAHDSFVKIAHFTGLGRGSLRRVASDEALRMDVMDLQRQVAQDRAARNKPFLVVGTAGTTAAGAFDPLPELADFCRREGLWFHVDAAYGGLALLVEELRGEVAGIEGADSVTWDAHKVLPVPMGAGMFFTRRREDGHDAFGVETGYVPQAMAGTDDPYQRSMQWSRRFIGLKVFLTIAELGWVGVASMLRGQVEMGHLLRHELTRAGFRLLNDSKLPVVCFSHPALAVRPADEVVAALLARGNVWISPVQLAPGEPKALRACVTNHRTAPEDVRALVAEVVAELSGGATRPRPRGAGPLARTMEG
jgi:aromatic-L-amino-acid decarboxylase